MKQKNTNQNLQHQNTEQAIAQIEEISENNKDLDPPPWNDWHFKSHSQFEWL